MIQNTTLFDNKSTQELIHADTTKGIYVTSYSDTSTYYYISQDNWCLGQYITFNKGMPKKIYISFRFGEHLFLIDEFDKEYKDVIISDSNGLDYSIKVKIVSPSGNPPKARILAKGVSSTTTVSNLNVACLYTV